MADALRYSIVVPVYNEEESITELAVRPQARAQPFYLVRETLGFDDWTGSAVSVADNQALGGRSGDRGG